MRLTAAALFLVFALNLIAPLPAAAMSTSKEVSLGAEISKQVDRESLLVDDPFLNSWVKGVGANLAQYRAREDINYTFSIINSDEINAFALPGGFVHVDMGLLNAVSSDDELAGVMAHEMGHVERRHAVTLQEKSDILGVLIGVLSILSPIADMLGGYGGELAMEKFSRQDELQADQYGLLLMSRAGYNPRAMVDFMDYLAKLESAPESKVDKAMLDHPVPADRISHLLGYPQLDKPTVDQLTAQAVHDEHEGRYSYVAAELTPVVKAHPDDALAAQQLASAEIALRTAGARAAADTRTDNTFEYDPMGKAAMASLVQTAASITANDATIADAQAKAGGQDAETLFTQLNGLSGGVPSLPQPKSPQSNVGIAIAGLDRLVIDVNGTLGLTSDVMATAPSLLRDNQVLLHEMSEKLRDGSPTPATQSVLPYYPAIASQLSTGSDELVRSVDRSRAAITAAADAMAVLKDYFVVLDSLNTTSGDIKNADMPKVQAALDKARTAWDGVEALALQADNGIYAAQSRWLSAADLAARSHLVAGAL